MERKINLELEMTASTSASRFCQMFISSGFHDVTVQLLFVLLLGSLTQGDPLLLGDSLSENSAEGLSRASPS